MSGHIMVNLPKHTVALAHNIIGTAPTEGLTFVGFGVSGFGAVVYASESRVYSVVDYAASFSRRQERIGEHYLIF